MEASLKKIHLALGDTCRPALALTSASRAMQMWLKYVEIALRKGVNRRSIIDALAEFNLSTHFVTEASVDLVKSSSRAMALSMTFFGPKLDDIIKIVTGGKKVYFYHRRRNLLGLQTLDRAELSFMTKLLVGSRDR